MKSTIFGYTSQGLPIPAYEFGLRGPSVLILGGVHGDEVEGVIAAHGLLHHFAQNFSFQLNLTLVPAFNLDGVLKGQRVNAKGVDLNRNLPTNDWSAEIKAPRYHPGPFANSEIENQHLVRFLEARKPSFIINLHSWKPCLNVNGKCEKEAEAIAQITGYQLTRSIGYPTPGCLGTYAGLEREMSTLTYELARGMSADEILNMHVPAILESLKVTERLSSQ